MLSCAWCKFQPADHRWLIAAQGRCSKAHDLHRSEIGFHLRAHFSNHGGQQGNRIRLIELIVDPLQELLLPDAPGLVILGLWPEAGQLLGLSSVQCLTTCLKIHAVVLG